MAGDRSARRRAAFVTILALLGELPREEKPRNGCPICGKIVKALTIAKALTGECPHCGTYLCKTCEKMHLGDATKVCPGDGVPVPREVR